MDASSKTTGSVADHLSNERTFLAWVRTGIALMGFGFVIVKFALFIRQIAVALSQGMGSPTVPPGKGYSALIGVTMVALGAVLTLLAYVRYRKVARQIDQKAYFPSKWLSALLTVSILTGAVLLVLYLVPNIR